MTRCFQVSIEMGLSEDWSVWYGWLEYFNKTGTPAGVIVHQELCSVWRAGERAGLGDKYDKPRGILHLQVHGFGDIWRANGGRIAKLSDRKVQSYALNKD